MYRSLSLLTLLATSGLTSAFAAPTTPQPQRPRRMPPMGQMPQHRMPRGMGLDLTPTQEKKIMALMRASFPQRRAIMQNTKLTPEQKRVKLQAIRLQFHNQMNAILTPAQRKKSEAMRKERRKWREQHEAGNDAAYGSQKMKATAKKWLLWFAAFIYAVNLLGSIPAAIAGNYRDFGASFLVGLGGLLLIYFTRPPRRQAITARYQEWKEHASRSRKQVALTWFGVWLASTCFSALFSWGLTTQTNLHTYQLLAKRGKTTSGDITAKEPQNHQMVRYTYRVGSKQFQGVDAIERPFDEVKVHDNATVYYDPANPKQSILRNPASALQNELLFHYSIALVFPLAMLINARKLLPWYHKPHKPLLP